MRSIALYTIFISYCIFNVLNAQEPAAFQITDQDGLPSMTVYQIVEDQQGYIWLGTQKGLSRYDGRRFKHIELPGFSDKNILTLQCDSKGRIWFNNLSGQIGYVEEGIGRIFAPDFFPSKHLPQRFIFQDSSMYIAYPVQLSPKPGKEKEKRIIRLDFDRQGIIKNHQELSGALVSSNIRFKRIGSTIYLDNMRLKKKANKMIFNRLSLDSILTIERRWNHLETSPFTFSKINLQYILPEEGIVFSDKGNGLYYLHDGQIQSLSKLSGSSVNQYSEIDKQSWVLTSAGLYFSNDLLTDSITQMYSEMNVNAIHKDGEGNLWIGTAGKGLYIIPGTEISVYSKKNGFFPQDEVHSLLKSSSGQHLYAGLSNGKAVRMHLKTKKREVISLASPGRITAIIEDEQQNIWFGADDGLYVYAPHTRQQIQIERIGACKVLTKDAFQNIWVGQASSVDKISPFEFHSDAKVISGKPKVHMKEPILTRRTYGLLSDFEGRIWMGTTKGLFLEEKGIVRTFNKENEGLFSVSSICQSLDSSIWVGTSGLGLLHIVDDRIVDTISLEKGLSSNNCTSLYTEENLLYIGTDNGLNILNLDDYSLSQLNDRDGLPSNEITDLLIDQGNIWLGTPRGLVHLPQHYQSKNEKTPPIYLSAVRINGEDQTTSKQDLAYWQNTLEFEFEGLAYRSRGTETYTYRLLGLEEDWGKIENRFIRFHRLPPGRYEFQVKAVNEDGVRSNEAASYFFKIATPWWKTPLFYGSLVIALMSLAGGLVYWRENERRKQEQLKNELENRILTLQGEALRTQMNPHFIYNTLNAIQDFLLTNDRTSALRYLSKFANMIRMIFDQSNYSSISLREELDFLNLYIDLEKLRFGERIEVDFEVEEELDQYAEMMELPPLLIQPIIENAFKHGLMHRLEGGLLKVHFSLVTGGISCIVEDNGVGRDKAAELAIQNNKKRKKSSLNMIEERLKMISSTDEDDKPANMVITDLRDDTGLAIGMRVTLFIASI